MASPSTPREDDNPLTKLLLEQLHKTCTLPSASELIDTACHICREPFLSKEIALKLRCGHLCGATCLIRWLAPLSNEVRNTCPMCRQPILGDLNLKDQNYQRERPVWLARLTFGDLELRGLPLLEKSLLGRNVRTSSG